MPISLISGLPGHGKTLRCLQVVERLRKESGREVYYHRIADLALPWKVLADPKKWMDVPDGSIVVIDEAHEVFPKRGPSAVVPAHVEQLATHRHRGIDIYLITQHAKNQLDHFVRGLVDSHQHVVRLFGAQRARVHRWARLGDPDNYHSLKESVTEQWSYPKDVFAWYKSAEVHTVKRKVPWKPIATIVGGFAVMVLVGWLAYASMFSTVDPAPAADPSLSFGLPGAGLSSAARSSYAVEDFAPSVQGAPWTAPVFQPAVAVTEAPEIVGCGSLELRTGGAVTRQCWCHTQQGTRADVSRTECLARVKSGSYRVNPSVGGYYPVHEPYVSPLAPPSQDIGVGGADTYQPAPEASDGF